MDEAPVGEEAVDTGEVVSRGEDDWAKDPGLDGCDGKGEVGPRGVEGPPVEGVEVRIVEPEAGLERGNGGGGWRCRGKHGGECYGRLLWATPFHAMAYLQLPSQRMTN